MAVINSEVIHLYLTYNQSKYLKRQIFYAKSTLYMFNAEHHVIIRSSLPNVIVDDSLAIEDGRLLDPEDNVDFGRNVAMFFVFLFKKPLTHQLPNSRSIMSCV